MAEKEKKQSVQTIQTKTRVEKGKSSIASVIFGRTGIIILLILLQFGFLIAGYTYLQGKMYFIDSVVKAGAVILVIYLTNNRSNPAFKMVWMTIMLVAPVFGVLLYIFVEFQVGVRWLNARLEHMHETTKKHWTQDEAVQEQLKEEDSEVASLAHYVCEYGGFPAYENTGVKYFSCGEDKIEELIRQLEKQRNLFSWSILLWRKATCGIGCWKCSNERQPRALKCVSCMMVPVRYRFCRRITRKNSNRKGLPAVCFHRSGRLCPHIRTTAITEKSW